MSKRIVILICLPVVLTAVVGLVSITGRSTAYNKKTGTNPFDSDPAIRVEACLTASPEQLVVLANDTDWRVRAAAYTALDRIAPVPSMPLRDTPMDQREQSLLGWLSEHEPRLANDLCEVFAHSPNAEFGDVLVKQCLQCHVGRKPEPHLGSDRCATCHTDIHSQWALTAHAQTLSHLQLHTVDKQTKQPGWYDFGDQRGMACIACHTPAGDHADCLATFRTVACASCHAQPAEQWEQWANAPRPVPADWPPGSISYETDTQAKTCTDCHMRAGEHRWAARRDPAFLREGLQARIRPAEDGGWQLVLTNLSGHDYPTGTRRRAIEVYLQPDGQAQQLITRLQPIRLPADNTDQAQEPLAPGEQRTIPLTPARAPITCTLIFVRNRFDDASYTCQILSIESPRHP